MSLSDYNYETWCVKSRLCQEMRILDAEIAATDGKIVLDAGSGTVEPYFEEYAARGLRAIRMDISINNLSTARKNSNSEDAYLLAGDVNNIPLAAESVDILFLCEVLEHLNAPDQALKEAHRILKSGGYIFIDVPWLHEVYRPLSAIALRTFSSFKRSGKPSLLLKILFKNLDEIDKLKESSMLKRRWLGSFLIKLARIFPTFRSFEPEYFIYNYYYGTIPEGNMHLQFRFPKEWAQAIRQAGFKLVRKTGARITPPPFNRSRLCNLLSSKLEPRLGDNILLRLSKELIIVAIKPVR